MKQLNLRLPDDVHAKLVALAQREGRSINNMLKRLIEQATEGQDRSDSPAP